MLDTPLYTISDVAAYLNLSQKTIRRMVKDYSIPHIIIRSAVRFDREQIERWVEKKTISEKKTA